MATIPTVPRRATEKLADEQALGGNIPQGPMAAPTSVDPSAISQGEMGGAKAIEGGADELTSASMRLQKVADSISERNDSLSRIADIRQFRSQAEAETMRLMGEGDLSRPETMQAYGQYLADLEQKTLSSHRGGANSKAALQSALANMGMGFSSQMGTVATKAQHEMLKGELAREITPLMLEIADRPENIVSALSRYELIVDQMPGSPEFKIAQKQAALGMMAETAINKFFATGQLHSIPGALNDVMDVVRHPQIAAALGPDKFNQIYMKVMGAQKESQADVKGIPRDIFNRMSPQDQQKVLTGGGVTVNVTPEQSYATKEAGEMARSNVEAVGKDRASGASAEQDLTRIQQIRSALDSGQFRTGALGETRQTVGRYLEFFGAPPDLIKAIGDPKQADVMEAASNWLATNAADKISRSTNLSLSLIRNSLPGLTRTMDGNRILLDILERTAKREVEIANLANVYENEYGTLRPKGKKSYFQARSDLMRDSPIVDDELKARIKEASAIGDRQREIEQQTKAAANAVRPKSPAAKQGGAQPKTPAGPPAVGTVESGYRFKGGNPGDQNNWEKVQ